MSKDTFDFWFLAGFRIALLLALITMLLYGRLYWSRGVRRHLILPTWAFINVATIFVLSILYNVVLQFAEDNIQVRRAAGLVLAYHLPFEAIVAIIFGIIIFRRDVV